MMMMTSSPATLLALLVAVLLQVVAVALLGRVLLIGSSTFVDSLDSGRFLRQIQFQFDC